MVYQGRALALPAGETEQSLRDYLAAFIEVDQGDDCGRELAGYLGDLRRFLYTLQLVPDGNGRLLEIGADPYFTTLLLERYRSYDLTLTNGFGDDQHGNRQRLASAGDTPVVMEFSRFNMELEELPFDRGVFDVVLCCEVLEHMTTDPLVAVCRLNEALKQGGMLILTTPNAARMQNVVELVLGRSVHDQFSGYGPYGRHNREYTTAEVRQLLEQGGFGIVDWFTADVYDSPVARRWTPKRIVRRALEWGVSILPNRRENTGFYMFVVASKVGPPNTCKPRWLYRSYDASEMCDV